MKIILEDSKNPLSKYGSYIIRLEPNIIEIGLSTESPLDGHYLICSKFYLSSERLIGPKAIIYICHDKEEVSEKIYECALISALNLCVNDPSKFINNTKRAKEKKHEQKTILSQDIEY